MTSTASRRVSPKPPPPANRVREPLVPSQQGELPLAGIPHKKLLWQGKSAVPWLFLLCLGSERRLPGLQAETWISRWVVEVPRVAAGMPALGKARELQHAPRQSRFHSEGFRNGKAAPWPPSEKRRALPHVPRKPGADMGTSKHPKGRQLGFQVWPRAWGKESTSSRFLCSLCLRR